MSPSEQKAENWIDCILAIEDAIPKQKIPSSSMLLAFLLAIKREAEPQETRTLSQLFIEELKISLADDKPPSTHDIISSTQASIDELNQIGSPVASQKAMLLHFPLSMLQVQLSKDVQNN